MTRAHPHRGLLTACFAAPVFLGLAGTLFPGNLTAMADEFCWARGKFLASATFAFGVAFLALIPVWVVANQNHNRKWVLWWAAIVSLAGFLAATFATAAVFAMLGAFLLGASTSGVESSVSTLAGELRPDRRAFFVSATQAMYAIGAGAAPFLIAGILSAGVSWRYSFAAAGAVSVFVVGLVPASKYHRHSKPAQHINVARALALVRELRFALLLASMICFVGIEVGVNAMSVQCFEEVYHVSSAGLLSKLPIAAFWLAMVPGRLIAGHLADRIGETKVVCAGLLLGMATTSLFVFAPGPGLALVWVAASGFAVAGVWPCIVSAVSAFYTEFVETRIALAVCAAGVGVMIFGAILGAVYDLASVSSRAYGARFTAGLVPFIAALSLGAFALSGKLSKHPLRGRENDV